MRTDIGKPLSLDRKGRLKDLAMATAFFLVLLLVQPAAAANGPPEKAGGQRLADKWGIEVVAIHTAAAGNMVDFRYKVLDDKKASAMFEKKATPYLIHQKSGKVLAVPRTAKVGPLMSSYHPKKDRIYWMFFGNQTKLVQPGDKVTVVIGELKLENLIVE